MASILWPILTALLIRQSLAQTPVPLYMSLGTPLERNTSRVLTMLLNGYDKRLRPNYGGDPVKVNVSMMVSSIGPINEQDMDYTVDMYFRTEWYDPRLTYTEIDTSLSLNAEMVDKVWIPDTYFVNEKDAKFHNVISKNSLIRLTREGHLLFSTRITVVASCIMDLSYFPMDKQRCHLILESYAYGDQDVQFKWLPESEKTTPIWVDDKIQLPQFKVLGYNNLEHTVQYYVGNYSQLYCTFYLGREISYYLIQTYMPASLIVVVSWLSFWIHRTATPARVALGITTVLTMTTLMGNAGSSLPKLSYVKSIDIFLGMCYFFVFAALLEFSLVCYFDKPRFKEARARNALIRRSTPMNPDRRNVIRGNDGDEIEISFENNRTTGTTVGKSNGSRYSQVTTHSSSPYHRPNRSQSRREEGPHGQHEHHGRHGQHGQHSQQSQAGPLGGAREGQVRNDDCLPEDIDCFKCECYQNLKQTGCDPGEPVKVNVSMMVTSIGPINEVLMEYTIDMYFRTEWNDPRLTYTEIEQGLNLNAEMVDKVWVPDTYFVNEKDARFHNVIAKNSLIRLSPNGQILFSTRVTVIASCAMNLAYFPMDEQSCNLVMESYAYSNKDIQFSWLKGKNDPIWVDNGISLPQFTLLGWNSIEHTAQYYVGNYSQLHCYFYLGREISYYLIQAYMPATLIVVVSWLSFWIHRTATPARVALGITTVLTMTTLMGNAGSSLPKLSYVKSIDIYLGMCYFYVFGALLEFSLVCYFDKPRFKEARTRRAIINRSGGGLMERRSVLKMTGEPEPEDVEVALDGSRATGPMSKNNGSRYTQVKSSTTSPYHRPKKSHRDEGQMGHMSGVREVYVYNTADTVSEDECCHLECCSGIKNVKDTGCDPGKIDRQSRVFFPITFLILSIIYWTYYQIITDITLEDLKQEDIDRVKGVST